MADKTYVVTAPCALINIEGNAAVMVQNGGPVPSNVTPDHLEHLLAIDFVAEAPAVGGLAPIVTGDLETVLTHPAGVDELGPDDVDGPDGPIPPKSADKGTWVDFAVSKGADRAEAEASTKDDLIAAYGQV